MQGVVLRTSAIYIVIVNVIGFVLMGVDKNRAKNHRWRIPEKTIFSLAAIGGSVGIWIGMQMFRHKTKHNRFVYGIPIIFVIQLLVYLLFKVCYDKF